MAADAMIELRGVGKVIGKLGARRWVLEDLDVTFDAADNYVVLGFRGSGKSTLLRVIAGISQPSLGVVTRKCSVSLPSGYAAGLGSGKTVRELLNQMAILYEADPREVTDYVFQFTGLAHLEEFPFTALPPTARSKLCYAMVYALPSDMLLLDDSPEYGEPEFRRNCSMAFEARRNSCGSIVTTRDDRRAREYGSRGALLYQGQLICFATVDEAIARYRDLEMEESQSPVAYAEGLVKRGEIAKAQEHLKQHLFAHGRTQEVEGQAYELLAQLSMKVGDYDEARTALRHAEDNYHSSTNSLLLNAKIAEREGRLEEVVALSERILEQSPDHREGQTLLARSYEGLNKNLEAARLWRRLGHVHHDQLSLRLAIRNFVKSEDWAGVASTIDALGSRPLDPRLQEMKAKAHIELDQWDEAKAVLRVIAERDVERAIPLLVGGLKSSHWRGTVDFLADEESNGPFKKLESRRLLVILNALQERFAAEEAQGAADDMESIQRALKALDGRAATSERQDSTESISTKRPTASAPDLATPEGIVQELYELRLNRSQMEPASYIQRNKEAWAAAKALASKGDGGKG